MKTIVKSQNMFLHKKKMQNLLNNIKSLQKYSTELPKKAISNTTVSFAFSFNTSQVNILKNCSRLLYEIIITTFGNGTSK